MNSATEIIKPIPKVQGNSTTEPQDKLFSPQKDCEEADKNEN